MNAPPSNDKYSDVYIEAKWLSRKISRLKRKSNMYMIIHMFLLFLLPCYTFVLDFFLKINETIDKSTTMLALSFVLFAFFSLNHYEIYVRRKLFYLFIEVEKDWSNLSDKIDWTDMRKKQLYRTLDDKIQEPINNFSQYRHSFLCPFERGRKVIFIIRLLFYLELFACPIITLYFLL